MTWVKICGITNLDDAKVAVEAGADAVGFVFHEKSARKVAEETVQVICRQLPPEVEKLGVFVGELPNALFGLVHSGSLTGLQMHFGVGSALSSGKATGAPPGCKVYLSMPAAVFVQHRDSARNFIASLERAQDLSAFSEPARREFFEAIFLDSGSLQQPGGTGMVFDWQKAIPVVEEMKRTVNVVVAGGLTPDNVAEAMRILNPWGVDVSSGVEAEPGKKDPEKVRAFISAVRNADKGA